MNYKQLAYSKKKVQAAIDGARKRMFLFTLLISFVVSAAFVFASSEVNAKTVAIGVGSGGATQALIMGAIGNIEEVANTAKSGKQVKGRLWLLAYNQFDQDAGFPTRTGITYGNIPLKLLEKWHYIDVIEDTPEPMSSGELGDVAANLKNTLKFTVGGLSDNLIQLLEDGIGMKFYVVWQQCNSGTKWLGGDACKPMKMISFSGGSSKDYTGFEITFENEGNKMYSKYSGNTPIAEPVTLAADAAAIAFSAMAQQYQLTDGLAAPIAITSVSGVSATDDGKVFDVLGSGGSKPSTISAGAVKSGAATYSFIEVSRVQTA